MLVRFIETESEHDELMREADLGTRVLGIMQKHGGDGVLEDDQTAFVAHMEEFTACLQAGRTSERLAA
jgi:hypothetical protein